MIREPIARKTCPRSAAPASTLQPSLMMQNGPTEASGAMVAVAATIAVGCTPTGQGVDGWRWPSSWAQASFGFRTWMMGTPSSTTPPGTSTAPALLDRALSDSLASSMKEMSVGPASSRPLTAVICGSEDPTRLPDTSTAASLKRIGGTDFGCTGTVPSLVPIARLAAGHVRKAPGLVWTICGKKWLNHPLDTPQQRR